MRKAGLILILCMGFFKAFAQETVVSEPKKLEQLYVSLGPGKAYSTSRMLTATGTHAALLITATYPTHKIFRAGLAIASFEDDQPATRSFRQDYPDRSSSPHHSLITPYFALGKRKLLHKFVQVQALAGLSFTWHHGPENVFRYTRNNGNLGVQELLDFTIVNRYVPGFVVQAEAMALPLRFAGFTLGGYYNFIPKISHAGIDLHLNLGKVRLKK